MDFIGSLLQLRGSELMNIPLRDPNSGNILLFNGEIYSGLDNMSSLNEDNDTYKLFLKLNESGHFY